MLTKKALDLPFKEIMELVNANNGFYSAKNLSELTAKLEKQNIL